MSQTPFDYRAATRELLTEIGPINSGPKLTLADQCTIYACLYHGIHQTIVARAFEVSRATASKIAGCRDDERKPIEIEFAGHSETHNAPVLTDRRFPHRVQHYRDVARVFEGLGEEEFMRTYLTPNVIERMKIANGRIKSEKT